jgi:hypothetical protein
LKDCLLGCRISEEQLPDLSIRRKLQGDDTFGLWFTYEKVVLRWLRGIQLQEGIRRVSDQ